MHPTEGIRNEELSLRRFGSCRAGRGDDHFPLRPPCAGVTAGCTTASRTMDGRTSSSASRPVLFFCPSVASLELERPESTRRPHKRPSKLIPLISQGGPLSGEGGGVELSNPLCLCLPSVAPFVSSSPVLSGTVEAVTSPLSHSSPAPPTLVSQSSPDREGSPGTPSPHRYQRVEDSNGCLIIFSRCPSSPG